MAAPVVTASLDKTAYAPGETMRLTVNHTDADRKTMSVTVTVTDSTGASGTIQASAQIDQGTVSVVSSPARSWVLESQTSGQAVFTAVA